MERAKDQLANRFFPVVLADLDTPTQNAAIDLIKFVRERSRQTAVIVMSRRIGFDAVAPVFRAGATDVIPKAREYVHDLARAGGSGGSGRQVGDGARAASRGAGRAERRAAAQDDGIVSASHGRRGQASGARRRSIARRPVALVALNLLLVDDGADMASAFEKELTEAKGWRIRHVQSGGEALDSATQIPPMVLVAKENLPDLTGSMVVNTIKASVPSLVAMVFAPPTPEHAGEVRISDQSRLHVLLPQLRGAQASSSRN
jgi:DNA-binding NtrC family response regulator